MLRDSAARWRDIVIYGLVAACALPPLLPLLPEAPATPMGWWAYEALLVLTLFGGVLWLRPRWHHFLQFWRFPPTLVAVPLAAGFCWLAARMIERSPTGDGVSVQENYLAVFVAAIAFMVAVVSGCALHAILRQRKWVNQPSQKPARQLGDLLSLEIPQLLAWVANEAPINTPDLDLFGFQSRAERIAGSLRRNRGETEGAMFPQTVVIQGPFGSGKSSLVQLVERSLSGQSQPRMLFVHFNCWGFDSTARAQEHVLTQCVDALHELIDCTSIRSAPGRYVRAISTATQSWAGVLADVFAGPLTPREQIARFAPLLRLADAQMVAVVEDTDRNGQDFDASHIEALLFHFRSVERISFILTAGANSRIEFPKVAERIEFLPPIPLYTTLALLDRARDHCRGQPHHDFVKSDERNSASRPENLLSQAYTIAEASSFGKRFYIWPEALGRLISHPRQLKQVINNFVSAWTTLRGEVDVDELLMVTALRHAAAPAFSYLGVHLHELRSLSQSNSSNDKSAEKERTKLIEELRAEWRTVAGSAAFDLQAAEVLLNELIPATNQLFGPRYYHHGNRIQSIVHRDGPDYWQRLTAEALDPSEVRDQDVLSVLARRERAAEEFAQRCGSSIGFAKIAGFVLRQISLETSEAQVFLSALHQELRHRLGVSANDDDPSLQAVRHPLSHRFCHDDAALVPWLEQEVRACIPGNLRLACDLYGFYARRTAAAPRVRQLIHDLTEEEFTRKPEQFALSIDPCFPWTLYHLLFAYGEGDPAALLARGQDWRFLVPILLHEMERTPNRVAHAVVLCFSDARPGRGEPATHVVWREELLDDFFAERKNEFFARAAILREIPEGLRPETRRHIELAITAAGSRARHAGVSHE